MNMKLILIMGIFLIGQMGAMEAIGDDKELIELIDRLEKIERILRESRVRELRDERNRTIRVRVRRDKVLGKSVRLEGKGHLSSDLRVRHEEVFKK